MNNDYFGPRERAELTLTWSGPFREGAAEDTLAVRPGGLGAVAAAWVPPGVSEPPAEREGEGAAPACLPTQGKGEAASPHPSAC